MVWLALSSLFALLLLWEINWYSISMVFIFIFNLLMLHYPWNGILGWLCGFENIQSMIWRHVLFPSHFYSSLLSWVCHHNSIHTWCRYIFPSAWCGGKASTYIRVKFSFLHCTRVHSFTKALHLFYYFLPGLYLEVSLWLIVLLVFSCAVTWFFKMLIDESFCEAWRGLQETLFDWLDKACWYWTEKCFMLVL